MSDYEQIEVDRKGSVGWIRLARPDALNALTPVMVRELDQALSQCEGDASLNCVVLIGKGRAFCAGADLKAANNATDGNPADFGEVGDFVESVSRLADKIELLKKPVIGAINGTAVAGGLELLLACDILYAASGAKIGDAHANYGMFPGGGATARLPRKLGMNLAKHLMFSGEMMNAGELLACGFVFKVVEGNELESLVQHYASQISSKSPLCIRLMKQLLNSSLDRPSSSASLAELTAGEQYRESCDYREGLAAFEEKRTPRFTGS